MPVVGHADQDGIDVRASQNLAVIDARADPVAEDLPGMDAPALVEVRNSDQLGSRYLERCLGVNEPDDAHADGCDPDSIIRAGLGSASSSIRPNSKVMLPRGVVMTAGRADARAADLRNDRREPSACWTA